MKTPKQPPSAEPRPKRRPYEPPQVVSEEVFETLALSCMKVELDCTPGTETS